MQGPSPRRQQMWVGSPQKMLPPDGDYPGGRCACSCHGVWCMWTRLARRARTVLSTGLLAGLKDICRLERTERMTARALRLAAGQMFCRRRLFRCCVGISKGRAREYSLTSMHVRTHSRWHGSTGIPEDGYIAYETGYMDDGPFHGELAPMQVSGDGVGSRTGCVVLLATEPCLALSR